MKKKEEPREEAQMDTSTDQDEVKRAVDRYILRQNRRILAMFRDKTDAIICMTALLEAESGNWGYKNSESYYFFTDEENKISIQKQSIFPDREKAEKQIENRLTIDEKKIKWEEEASSDDLAF